MPKFISDADMASMESSSGSSAPDKPKKAKFLSDDEMREVEHKTYRESHKDDGFIDKIKDPKRWQAVLNNTGPYADKDVIAGTAPLVIPGSVVPKLAQAAGALANGQGIGYAAGRTALSIGQGVGMSALESKEGESWQDKIDRAKSAGKLSGGIQLAAEALPVVGKLAKFGGTKIASLVSGADENLIANYANRTDEVNNLIRNSGGDMTEAADQVRTELSAGIQKTKGSINSKITKALEGVDPYLRVDHSPIIEALETAKSKLNPNFKSSAITEIDEMISAIKNEAKDGGLSAQGLYQVKQFLNEGAKSSYNKGGQIFTRAGEAARAAKDAANKARESIKSQIPEIAQADQQLSKLHQIEQRLNKNMLAPGKPDASLFSAGSGANPRNAANLRELESISGVPVMQRTRDLATAKTFANPSLLPSDATGKVVARMAVGAGIGGLYGGKEGAMIGGALASPFSLKYGINAVNLARDLTKRVPNFAKLTRENPVAAQAIIQLMDQQLRRANPEKPLPPEAEEFLKQNPRLLENAPIQNKDRKPSAELKGEALWMQRGAEKLGIDPSGVSNKDRRLLIEASDLPANSKRLQSIKNQIQGRGK